MTLFKRSYILGLALILDGCVPTPRLADKGKPLAVQDIASAKVLDLPSAPLAQLPDEAFTFGDPQLAELISKALAGSPHYAQALSRIAQADALVTGARSDTLPQLAADGSLSEAQLSKNNGFPPQFVPSGLNDNARLSLSAMWNLDLWGRNAAALRAAKQEAEAARLDGAQARLMLITSIVHAYADFGRAFVRAATAAQISQARTHQLALVNERFHAGLENALAVADADAQAGTAHSDAVIAKGAVRIMRYRLAALIGVGPDEGLKFKYPSLIEPTVDFEGANADMVAARPDVLAARARVEAAAARVKVAARDFYPNISLSGLVGYQSLDIQQLLKSDSFIPSFGPAVHLPIFSAGALQGAYRAQRADYDTAVSTYNETLINALEAAGSGLVRLGGAKISYANAQRVYEDAEKQDRLTRARFKQKLVSEIAIITSQTLLDQAQLALENARLDVITNQTDMYRILGGTSVQPVHVGVK